MLNFFLAIFDGAMIVYRVDTVKVPDEVARMNMRKKGEFVELKRVFVMVAGKRWIVSAKRTTK